VIKGRLEDDRMLTGRGKYVSDWNLPGQAYGHFVRSDRAHADIVSLDVAAARAQPGVIAVITGEDIRAALKSLPCALPVKGRGGMELIHPGRPALAQGRVRFTGEPVALVVARSAVAAQDAAELLNIEYRGRPVEWTGTRSEVFLADEQARGLRSRGALAVDSQGKILGMRFDMLADLGAYLAPTGPFINTIGIVNCLSGVYDVPAAYARIRLALTNTAPMAAYRGAGRPIMSYALERLVEHAAHQLGIDPAEFRRRNFIRRFPYKIAAGFEYDSGDFEGVMNKALAAADWRALAARKAESKRRGKLRGRGMSTYIEATGAGFAPQDQIEMRWSGDGRLTLYAPTHSHGQGHETTYAQLVSGVLGIPMEKIGLRTAGADFYITGNATGGSRSLLAVGGVIYLGAQELVKKGMALAAEALEAAHAVIEFAAGEHRIKGTQ